ncbi:MAG: NAD(P)/FAD-dependent oxidoreductase, partial [Candidatus Kariarchaeaceae archaeon]
MFQRPTPPDINTDYLIIGAGVAGISLARKLKESGQEVWLLGSAYESQIAKAGALKNVTSIPEGTIGLDHIEDMINTAKEIGVNHKTSLCTEIEPSNPIVVKTKHQKFIAKKVIIATGAKQPRLDFEGEQDFYHKGISDCAVCDWGLFRGKDVAVIGNHDYTRRAAEFMKQHAGKVSLLWLSDQIDFEIDNVNIYTNVTKMVASGSEVLEDVSFDSNQGPGQIQISGLFVEGKP